MGKKEKKEKKSSGIGAVIGILVLVGAILYVGGSSLYTLIGCATAKTSIEEAVHNQTGTSFATGTVHATTSEVLSMKHSVNFIPTGTDYYYIIFPEGENYCMTVRAPEDWDLDNFTQTYKTNGLMLNYSKEGVKATGQVKKLEYKARDHIANTVNNYINRDGRDYYISDYFIDFTATKRALIGLLGFLCILFAVIALFIGGKKENKTLIKAGFAAIFIGLIAIIIYI